MHETERLILELQKMRKEWGWDHPKVQEFSASKSRYLSRYPERAQGLFTLRFALQSLLKPV